MLETKRQGEQGRQERRGTKYISVLLNITLSKI